MMNRAWRRAMVRRTLLWIWAMITMILVVCVGLLARELMRGEGDPLAFIRPESKPAPVPSSRAESSGPMANKEVTLYFADTEGKMLAPETSRIEAGASTVENCRKALESLIHGPRDILTPVLPASTRIRGLYMLEGGQLVVDFSSDFTRELKRVRSASLESLMVYSVVNTLANDTLRGEKDGGVANVRFLVEGTAPHESFPSHLDLSGPIKPDSRWIAGGGT